MRKYPTSSLHCRDYRRSAHGLFGTRESDRRFLALAARRLGASDGSLASTNGAARPALCGDVRALRVGQQVDGQLHGPNGRAKGNDRLGAPDRSGRSELRRPCPAAALGIGEQPSMSPQPSIKFRPTIRLGCAAVNENDSSTYNCGFHSYAHCYATIYGNGGWCRPNFFEPSGRDCRTGKTRPPARY